jgi:3-oxoacyl-[acyl-carrier protein] reductase
MNPAGKIVLVTGAGRGIGKAIALKLAESGATVIVNSLSQPNIDAVVAGIKASGGLAAGMAADVSSPEDVLKLFSDIISAYGRLDILVNNAGVTRDQLLLRMTDEEWDEVIATDLKSVFLCTRAAFKYMVKERRGRIISISSVVGLIGNAGQSNYAAAKAGIIGFTRAASREVASRGITVNAVAPGFIETDMTSRLAEKQKLELLSRIPAGYFGTPEDVAGVVVFLASDSARYITGQVITIDGGMTGA